MEKGIPFFKIKKDSRIALYGGGNNGLMCYKQLIKSGFCRLSIWVDSNCAGEILEDKEIKTISELKTAMYDYVLVTIIDELISKQVKNYLINIGIQEDKIITMNDKTEAIAIKCLDDKELIQKYLDDNFEKRCMLAKRANEYYPEIEEMLIENIHDKNNVLHSLKALLNSIIDDKKKFILLDLMYKNGYFDRQCMEIFMKFMCNNEWLDDTYFDFIIDSTVMVFLHPDYIYKEFFADRRVLQKKYVNIIRLMILRII